MLISLMKNMLKGSKIAVCKMKKLWRFKRSETSKGRDGRNYINIAMNFQNDFIQFFWQSDKTDGAGERTWSHFLIKTADEDYYYHHEIIIIPVMDK